LIGNYHFAHDYGCVHPGMPLGRKHLRRCQAGSVVSIVPGGRRRTIFVLGSAGPTPRALIAEIQPDSGHRYWFAYGIDWRTSMLRGQEDSTSARSVHTYRVCRGPECLNCKVRPGATRFRRSRNLAGARSPRSYPTPLSLSLLVTTVSATAKSDRTQHPGIGVTTAEETASTTALAPGEEHGRR